MIWTISSSIWITTILALWYWTIWWHRWNISVKNSVTKQYYSDRLKLVMTPAIINLVTMIFPDIQDLLHNRIHLGVVGLFFDVLLWSGFIYQLQKFLRDDDFFTKMKSKLKRWARNTFTVRRLAPVTVTGR